MVCCPLPDFIKLSLNQRACSIYHEAVYDDIKNIQTYLPDEIRKSQYCRGKKPVGGILAHPRQFPHMAVLGFQELGGEINWACGGTLISNRFVLTAGHCLQSSEHGDVKYVRLGIINLEINPNQTSDCPEHFNVLEIISHPNYTRRSVYNDIALLKLDRDVIFNPDIRPACLGDMRTFSNGTRFQAMGFGQVNHDGDRTEHLIYVELEEFSHTECNDTYKFSINRRFKDGIIDETQLCAGSRKTIQDTCPGDSGGPIQIDHPIYYKAAMVVGLTSFGKSCGFKNSPAVYTRIFPYLNWIESIVWPYTKYKY